LLFLPYKIHPPLANAHTTPVLLLGLQTIPIGVALTELSVATLFRFGYNMLHGGKD